MHCDLSYGICSRLAKALDKIRLYKGVMKRAAARAFTRAGLTY